MSVIEEDPWRPKGVPFFVAGLYKPIWSFTTYPRVNQHGPEKMHLLFKDVFPIEKSGKVFHAIALVRWPAGGIMIPVTSSNSYQKKPLGPRFFPIPCHPCHPEDPKLGQGSRPIDLHPTSVVAHPWPKPPAKVSSWTKTGGLFLEGETMWNPWVFVAKKRVDFLAKKTKRIFWKRKMNC